MRLSKVARGLHLVRGIVLGPFAWLRAWLLGSPGTALHGELALALGPKRLLRPRDFRSWLGEAAALSNLFDTFRYFEFDFVVNALAGSQSHVDWVDVSSPRLLLLALLRKHPNWRLRAFNPDAKDLAVTQALFREMGVDARSALSTHTVQSATVSSASADVVTCISVLEHIEADEAALQRMWDWLKPGGSLFLSVPCAREAFEEHIDFDEYQLAPRTGAFVFGQRFYDAQLLEQRIFRHVGSPSTLRVIGEKAPGTFAMDRAAKLTDVHYPFWREPLRIGRDYRIYPSIDALPGWGVVAMRFDKRVIA